MKSYHRKFFFACQNKSDRMQNPELKPRTKPPNSTSKPRTNPESVEQPNGESPHTGLLLLPTMIEGPPGPGGQPEGGKRSVRRGCSRRGTRGPYPQTPDKNSGAPFSFC